MSIRKNVLYFSPMQRNHTDFAAAFDRQDWLRNHGPGVWDSDELTLNVDPTDSFEEVIERLSARYYNLVVLDCRHIPDPDGATAGQEEALRGLLDTLGKERSRERAYPFARIAVLVGDADEARVDRLIFELGQRHVGGCFRDLSLSPRLVGSESREAQDEFVRAFWDFCRKTLLQKRSGKKAISAAGGGITGIYYELGVLKCLDDACDLGVGDYDMYYGISAGALVTGFLVNGFSIDDMIANVGGVRNDWPKQLRLSWRQLNIREIPRRVLMAQQDFATYVIDALRGQADPSVFSALWSYERAFGPMFDNSELEEFLADIFTRLGQTNSFAELDAEFYVGATDQDRRRHVLFGEGEFRDVPISKAIQASSAAHPFFRSVKIGDRYYTDGIVTRTSNMKSAISKGADLIFIIDPFLPAVSATPGFNARHGNLWVAEQDIKTLAFTRFAQMREEILRQNPQVNSYTFVPSNRMRRLMSQNPFIAQNFHPIVCEAYRSTYRRLRQLEYKIAGELASHGIGLDLAPVAKKVEVLRGMQRQDVRALLDSPSKPSRGKAHRKPRLVGKKKPRDAA